MISLSRAGSLVGGEAGRGAQAQRQDDSRHHQFGGFHGVLLADGFLESGRPAGKRVDQPRFDWSRRL
jgi:hypothetical protein